MTIAANALASSTNFNAAFASKSSANTLSGVQTLEKEAIIKHNSTPSNPSSGYVKLYFKNDNKLYSLNSSGSETQITPSTVITWSISTSKTSTYTAAVGEVVRCSASGGSFTVNFPTASGISGQSIRVVRTDQTLANSVTVDFSGSETGGGSTTVKLCTQNEFFDFVSDGTNWIIANHYYPSVWASYSPTIGATTTPPTEGSGVTKLIMWRREGDSMRIRWQYKHTGAGSAGTGAYLFPLPTGVTANSSKVTVSTASAGDGGHIVGNGYGSNSTSGAATTYHSRVFLYNTSNMVVHHQSVINTCVDTFGSASLQFSATNINFSFEALIPITDWEG